MTDEFTASPSSAALNEFEPSETPKSDEAKCWLSPKRGAILLAIKTEDQLEAQEPGRIIKPHISLMSHSGRIFGHVLAVGDPPRLMRRGVEVPYDKPWPMLEFGDVVELSREDDSGTWWKKPVWALFGEPSEDAYRVFAPADGGPERYRLTNKHYLAIVAPSAIICRWGTRRSTHHGDEPFPFPRPVADRVLIRNANPPEKSAGGIILPHWFRRDEPIGEVMATGWDVEEVAAGDWVRVRPDRGARMEGRDGAVYTFLHESDVLGRWDSEPSESEKLAHSAELGER